MTEERRAGGIPGAIGVLVLDAVLAAASVALFLGVVEGLETPDSPWRVPWPLLAAAFAVAEILVVHIQFERNAYSFSFSEVPLVVGLFLLAPRELVLAQVVGVLVVLAVHRRQSGLKLVFNLGVATLQANIALAVLHTVTHGSPTPGPLAAGAALAGTLAGLLVSSLSIGLAISLAERASHSRTSFRMLGVSGVGVITNTALALVAVQVLWSAAWASVLLVVPAAALFFAYRAYTAQREQRESLEFLYEAIRILDRREVEDALADLLRHAREMFRAEIAEIVLFPVMVGEHAFRTTSGPGDRLEILQPVDLETFGEAWGRLLEAQEPVLLPRSSHGERALPEDVRDAMFATLVGEARVVGTLLVADRLGDVSTFGAEDLRLFATLASHASIALENGRLERTLAEVSALEQERATLLEKVVQATEDERARISAELHDGPVQRLSAISMALDRVRVHLGRGDLDGVRELIGPAQRWLADEVHGLRQLMAELRPPVLDERGLMPALEDYAAEFQEATGISAMIDVRVPGRLAPASETVLYRVAQEALTNVRKHAAARTVWISLGSLQGSIVLEVRDDGVGFDPGERVSSRTHVGLSVMRERMEMAGGKWELFSEPGRGTTILATLPAEEDEPEGSERGIPYASV